MLCGLWLGPGVAKAADPGALHPSAALPGTKAPSSRYRYIPAGKADPFRPFLELDENLRKKMVRPKPVPISPLQRAAIDQFRLVGIAGDARRRAAVVEGAAGKFYTIRRGTVIGQNGGRVTDIQADRVIVEEKLSGKKKQTKVNRVVMKLRKEGYEGEL